MMASKRPPARCYAHRAVLGVAGSASGFSGPSGFALMIAKLNATIQ
jgi:hypothetical protein